MDKTSDVGSVVFRGSKMQVNYQTTRHKREISEFTPFGAHGRERIAGQRSFEADWTAVEPCPGIEPGETGKGLFTDRDGKEYPAQIQVQGYRKGRLHGRLKVGEL